MTKTEAQQCNRLLRFLLEMTDGPGVPHGAEFDQAARSAEVTAMWLADRAHAALMAGLTGTDVREHWPHLEAKLAAGRRGSA